MSSTKAVALNIHAVSPALIFVASIRVGVVITGSLTAAVGGEDGCAVAGMVTAIGIDDTAVSGFTASCPVTPAALVAETGCSAAAGTIVSAVKPAQISHVNAMRAFITISPLCCEIGSSMLETHAIFVPCSIMWAAGVRGARPKMSQSGIEQLLIRVAKGESGCSDSDCITSRTTMACLGKESRSLQVRHDGAYDVQLHHSCSRKQLALIKPYVQFSRIRLSDVLHTKHALIASLLLSELLCGPVGLVP